jgi:chromate transport protein ChrA
MHILLPKGEPFNWFAAIVGVVAFLGMWRWKWSIIPVIIGAGILGLLYKSLHGFS